MSERGRLLRVLGGETVWPPPLWVMRQAGRYLPEYRETRRQAGSFLDLCYNPELAAEVTLQPIRRFDFDAAILFSDILVVPHALGQSVSFAEGIGPRLGPLPPDFGAYDRQGFLEKLGPVLQTVRHVRRDLAPEKALIGFCGAPWTVATYMIAGQGTPAQEPARRMALERPRELEALIAVLVAASADYLVAQLHAGADAVQIFDSWAGTLDTQGFEAWAVAPVRAVIERVRAAVPGAPVIAFPKGAGGRLGVYAAATGAEAVGVDWTLPLRIARSLVGADAALQGNLDPLRLVVGGAALDDGVDAVLRDMRGAPHIFNLGHGITPDTPVDNVYRLVERVRREGGT